MYIFKHFYFILIFSYTTLYAENHVLEKVTLQLQWKHQFEFAGFYAAKEKGFFRDAGLDVIFVEFDETKNITDDVINGNAEYGLTYSSIIAEYLNGKPLVLLANFFKQSPLVLVTHPDIKTPADLKGKRVMGVSDSIHNLTLLTMMNKFGVDYDDIVNIPASFSLDDFINKKVDAMSVFTTNELYHLNQLGVKFNLFDPIAYGAKYYDVNLFTTEKELLYHPQRAKRFRAASIKGWEYALENQDEIIDIIIKKYNPQNKSKDALRFEAKQIEQLMLPNVYKVGSVDIDRIRMISDNFIQSGFVEGDMNRSLDDFVYEDNTNTLGLTYEEKKYLLQKKLIKMCVDPDWMPFEIIKNGKHLGMSADYINLISSKINIPITLIPTRTWSESLSFAKERKCDILSLVMQTPERKKFMNVTKPYLTTPFVIATTNDKFFISDIRELEGKQIGIVKGYAHTELLQRKYPSIDFVEVDSLEEGLTQVSKGFLFGFIDSLATMGYQIQKRFPKKLKISGQLEESGILGIGVRNDDPILFSIFEKAVNLVGEKKIQKILNQWIAVRYENRYDSALIWKILTPFLFLVFLLLISQYLLKQYNTKLKNKVAQKVEELREKDKILMKKARMSAMGEMLSMIAHQWHQPLSSINSIILGIKIKLIDGQFNLEDENNRKQFLEFLENRHNRINEYIGYLSSTTDDFRNFFNPQKKSERILLSNPIHSALNIIQPSLEKNGIELIMDLQVDNKLILYHNEIMQVMLNILKNSEENFLEKNTLKPNIFVTTLLDKNRHIIRICDNGGGIADDIINTIFDPYVTTKSEKDGTGLGLYMSKMIIENHQNSLLNVKNMKDGVCFEIIFMSDKSEEL